MEKNLNILFTHVTKDYIKVTLKRSK